jgi:hypothetical protein
MTGWLSTFPANNPGDDMNTIIRSLLLSLCCGLAGTPVQGQLISVDLSSGTSMHGYILGVTNDTITFVRITTVWAPFKRTIQEMKRVHRQEVEEITFEGRSFRGIHSLTGLGVGLLSAGMIGLVADALTERGEKAILAAIIAIPLMIAAPVVGLLAGFNSDVEETTSSVSFNPGQIRDYLIIQAHLYDSLQLHRNIPSLRRAWWFANSTLPKVTVTLSDGKSMECFITHVDSSGLTLMECDIERAIRGGHEAERYYSYDRIVNITRDKGGFFRGGDTWSWDAGSNIGILKRHSLSHIYPETAAFAPSNVDDVAP